MGSLKAYFAKFDRGYAQPEPPDVPYAALIAATDGTPAHTYALLPGTQSAVGDVTAKAADLGTAIGALAALDDHLPKPSPNLVVRGSLES
jgi:hypothetical protein